VRQKDRSLVPDLIDELVAKESPLADEAAAALRKLSGQDFGPPAGAGAEARARAAAAWRDWWLKQDRP
jgi:hypothetical protein